MAKHRVVSVHFTKRGRKALGVPVVHEGLSREASVVARREALHGEMLPPQGAPYPHVTKRVRRELDREFDDMLVEYRRTLPNEGGA